MGDIPQTVMTTRAPAVLKKGKSDNIAVIFESANCIFTNIL